MLKGVNRQVVEVSEPDSAYFEKVLFFVKPDCAYVSEKKLKGKADEMIAGAGDPPRQREHSVKKGKAVQWLKLLLAAAAGAAAAGLTAVIF